MADWALSPGTVNILLAVLAVAAYMLVQQWTTRRAQPASGSDSAARASASTSQAQASTSAPARKQPSALVPSKKALGQSALSAASHRVFKGIPTLSLDCKALFADSDESAVQDGITLDPRAVEAMKEAAHVSKVYMILHDTSADGMLEAVVCSSLELAGVVGDSPGQIPRHRLLVCSTVVGKVAIVRQLEAAQHVECDSTTHEELSRFGVPQWLVQRPGGSNAFVERVLSTTKAL